MTILALAWTLGDFVSNQLKAGLFVSHMITARAISLDLLPVILFMVAVGLAFSTGTSWRTFGILIPIVTAIFSDGTSALVIFISSILAGAVCGDHISPISDTTLMASAGAPCHHVSHVSMQLPYAFVVFLACVVGYVVSGYTCDLALTLPSAFSFLFIEIAYLVYKQR